jgi:hypothetical protein
VSDPKRSIRLSGTTAIAVKTPLKVSERSLVEEKLALLVKDVYTPIRLAVVPVTSSPPPVMHKQ